MKKSVILILLNLVCSSAFADQTPSFLEVAKNTDGSVRFMNWDDADEYCSNQGAHLPSARELAQLSISLGAKGYVDSCFKIDSHCDYVQADVDGPLIDIFSFDHSGYKPQKDGAGDSWLWSSSNYFGDYYFLRGNGAIDYFDRGGHLKAARCVAGLVSTPHFRNLYSE